MSEERLPLRGNRSATVAVVVCAVVVLAVAAWAAVIGPEHVLRGEGDIFLDDPVTRSSGEVSTDTSAADPEGPPEGGGGVAAAVGVAVAVAMGLILVVGVVLLIGVLRSSVGVRERDRSPREQPDPDEVLSASARDIAAALASDAGAQFALLRRGTPRNAIVACWQRFEILAATVGLERELWETSSEHALRVLGTAGADPRAVILLEEAFREARFSEHELDEDARARAIELLEIIHLSLADAGART